MGFQPSVADGARALYKSLCRVLWAESFLQFDPDSVEKNEQLIEDPFDVSNTVNLAVRH
jgi:hypothetical protein